MSGNVFTLDSLREETRKKFEPAKIGLSDESQVELRSLLRLNKDDRKTVIDALEKVNGLEADEDDTEALEFVVEEISAIFNAICDKPAKLLKELDDDDLMIKVTLMTSVLARWARETQLGEVQNSPA